MTTSLPVTVAICAHNSEILLPDTLRHLRAQVVHPNLPWEVLVIDNVSSDQTASMARRCWDTDGPAPMRVIQEGRLGLSYARERAFEEAQYDIVSFIDDDNWAAPDWVATASECMSVVPELAAIGSVNTAVADVLFPEWFSRYCNYYAAWAFRESATIPGWLLFGAGMTIRKTAWNWLRRNGFSARLTDRTGARLSSSGDVELGCALQLAGWKIQVEPRLRLKHYITPHRLQWAYLRRLIRGIGESHVVLDSYLQVAQSRSPHLLDHMRRCWLMRLGRETLQLARRYPARKLIVSVFREMEGDDDIAQLEFHIGRLLGLVRMRSRYNRLRRDIARAPWRKVNSIFESNR